MKHITFYLDFISPYAYLAFEELPKALMGLSYAVTYKPILFAALLKHHGQLGPAEIPSKRDWTYRQVLWLAHRKGVDLQMPATHPFNPLGLLRLAVASDPAGLPNRYVCETLFRHAWTGGADAASGERVGLAQYLVPAGQSFAKAFELAQRIAHGLRRLAVGGVEQAIEGAYFAKQMQRARKEGRIGRVPVDGRVPVNTFWDFGVNDHNSIWLHQRIGAGQQRHSQRDIAGAARQRRRPARRHDRTGERAGG